MSKGGRPADPEARLSQIVNFRLTAKEFDEICRAAIKAGKSVNQHVRDLVRLGMSVVTKPPNPLTERT